MCYTKGIKRPRGRPDSRDHEIRKQTGRIWSRYAKDRQTWSQLNIEYVRKATP